jgi:hypothetical protein
MRDRSCPTVLRHPQRLICLLYRSIQLANTKLGSAGKKVSGAFCAKHPEGRFPAKGTRQLFPAHCQARVSPGFRMTRWTAAAPCAGGTADWTKGENAPFGMKSIHLQKTRSAAYNARLNRSHHTHSRQADPLLRLAKCRCAVRSMANAPCISSALGELEVNFVEYANGRFGN